MNRPLANLAMATSIALSGACHAAPKAVQTSTSGQTACFSAHDNQKLPFAVIQQAPPPPKQDAGYRYYPLNAVATMQLSTLDAAIPGIDTYFFQWANRSTAPFAAAGGRMTQRKANFQPSALGVRKQRSGFSSIARADACTLAQLGSLLGTPNNSGESGIKLVSEADLPDRGAQGPVDTCVMPAKPLPASVRGVLLDFEVADGRTPDQTRKLLIDYADRLHRSGRRAILLIDPFNAPTQRQTGIGPTNASAIVSAFDMTTLMLWSGNVEHDIAASYRAQRSLVDAAGKVDPHRLIIDFDLSGTSIEDAAFVHETILRDRLGGVIFWRNRVEQGGDCANPVNRKIAAVVFGPGANQHASGE